MARLFAWSNAVLYGKAGGRYYSIRARLTARLWAKRPSVERKDCGLEISSSIATL